MATPAMAAAGAAAASATMLAYGFLVMSPREFLKLVSSLEKPLVVVITTTRGVFAKRTVYTYAAPLGGLVAATRSPEPLQLPDDAIVVEAERLLAPAVVEAALRRVLHTAEAEG